jgi:hypothetical protein
MVTVSKRSIVLVGAACLLAGYWLTPPPRPPVGPGSDRPILRAIVKVAKSFLWLAVFAEGGPAQDRPEPQLVRAEIGADGFRRLEHARGW